MCRLVIWNKLPHVASVDAFLEAERFKPGMIVDVVEDGIEPISAQELVDNPFWVIVDIPGAPVSDFAGYAQPQKRSLDTTKIPQARPAIFDISGLTFEDFKAISTQQEMEAVKTLVPYADNPNDIGADPHII